ncbi:uncharacterized protein LOC143918934 [Arctopsyche grandis]|uniref:uncharacterized protein LOC143918934 n=1 Tax=Arctopsyche grandis TaxID=121162 RepID=UPI00406D98BE
MMCEQYNKISTNESSDDVNIKVEEVILDSEDWNDDSCHSSNVDIKDFNIKFESQSDFLTDNKVNAWHLPQTNGNVEGLNFQKNLEIKIEYDRDSCDEDKQLNVFESTYCAEPKNSNIKIELVKEEINIKSENIIDNNHSLDDVLSPPNIQVKCTENKIFKCDYCPECYTEKHLLIGHIISHTNETVISRKNDLESNSPINSTQPHNPHVCQICTKTFAADRYLKRHMKIHVEGKPHKCEICSKAFVDAYHLKQHVQIHFDDKPFKCEICSKGFAFSRDVKRHMKIHSDDGFKCDICSKKFQTKQNLNTHTIVHTGEKPHKCELCSKVYSYKIDLNHHMKIHTGKDLHVCNVCSKAFPSRSKLMRHAQSHTGERPHKCDTCSKRFFNVYNLNRHVQSHSGERSYKCEFCSKTFYNQSMLNSHVKIHVRGKSYKCEICSKAFSTVYHMNRHLKCHGGEKPHTCESCSKEFANKDCFSKHICEVELESNCKDVTVV